jgi:hypothetical protein
MCLAVFVDTPARVSSAPLGQPLDKAGSAMLAKRRSHGYASPERRDNQSDVIVRESDPSVCHEAYGTIAPLAAVKTSWAHCYHVLERWPS